MARRKTAKKKRTRPTLKVYSVAFVQASDIVPESWYEWFWPLIAEDAPFSWGDNDYSIISIRDFMNHCETRIAVEDLDSKIPITKEELDTFYRKLKAMGNLWLDMECKSFPSQW